MKTYKDFFNSIYLNEDINKIYDVKDKYGLLIRKRKQQWEDEIDRMRDQEKKEKAAAEEISDREQRRIRDHNRDRVADSLYLLAG